MQTTTRRGTGLSGGLRLKKAGEKSSTDAEVLRAARMRKYEAFHGVGQSLSGATSTTTSMSFINRGNSLTSTPLPEETKCKEEEEEKKPSIVPFEGEGRRLR